MKISEIFTLANLRFALRSRHVKLGLFLLALIVLPMINPQWNADLLLSTLVNYLGDGIDPDMKARLVDAAGHGWKAIGVAFLIWFRLRARELIFPPEIRKAEPVE